MTILHAHSDTDFTHHLRAVLAEANSQPHSVDIAVGYFYYLSSSLSRPARWRRRPGKVRIPSASTFQEHA